MYKKKRLTISILTFCLMILSACNFFDIKKIREEAENAGGGKIFTVTFNSNGGEAVPSQKVAKGNKATLPEVAAGGHPINYTGGTFVWWFKEAVCVNPWDFQNDTVTGNMTLYAAWNAANDYSVIFFANKGTFAGAGNPIFTIKETSSNLSGNMPANPSRTDFIFSSWNTNAEGNGTDFNDTTTVSASIAVYANWTSAAGSNDASLTSVTVAGNSATLGTPDEDISLVTAGDVGMLSTQFANATIVVTKSDPGSAQTFAVVNMGGTDPSPNDFTAQATVNLADGDTIWIKSINGIATLYYAITVTERLPSADADILELEIDGEVVTLTGGASTIVGVTPDAITLKPYQLSQANLLLTKSDPFSTQMYMIEEALIGFMPFDFNDFTEQMTVPVDLADGDTIWIWSLAENETDEMFYAVTVIEIPLSADADILDLEIDGEIITLTGDTTIAGAELAPDTINLTVTQLSSAQEIILTLSDPFSTQKYMIDPAPGGSPPASDSDFDQEMYTPASLADGDTIWIWSLAENGTDAMYYAVLVSEIPPSSDAVILTLEIDGEIIALTGDTTIAGAELAPDTITLTVAQLSVAQEIILTLSDPFSAQKYMIDPAPGGSPPASDSDFDQEMDTLVNLADSDTIWIWSLAENGIDAMYYAVEIIEIP